MSTAMPVRFTVGYVTRAYCQEFMRRDCGAGVDVFADTRGGTGATLQHIVHALANIVGTTPMMFRYAMQQHFHRTVIQPRWVCMRTRH